MPRFRTWLIGLGTLLAIVLLAVWQVPGWLDWTRYRTSIEVLASSTLGQPVTIKGPIALTLLPQPVLTAAQVSVGESDAGGFSIRVDALRLRVALWPLLGGHVDARELVLRGPDLRIPWPAEPGMLRVQPPAWLAAFSARIEDGRVTVGRLSFTGIEARLDTLDTGALSAGGTAKLNDKDWNFTARLTAAGPDGASGLNITLDGQGKAAGLGASFTGQLAADGSLAGAVTSRGPNLALLLPAPPVAFRADGRLTVGSGLVVADDVALEIGGSPATAAVALRVAPQQRLDIALAASRLDLDGWLPVLTQAGTSIAGVNLPVGLDLSAESAPFRGGTLERLRAAFELTGNDVTLREGSALLPGDAMLLVSGRIARGDPAHPRFEGSARLQAPVLRNTLRWLQDTAPWTLPPGIPSGLPAGLLQRAALSAHVAAGAGEFVAQDITGSIDDTGISGSFGLKRGEPSAIVADLAIERLRLDPLLPARMPRMSELTRLASGIDADLRFKVRDATLAGATLHDLVLDAGLEAGSLVLRRLEAAGEGAHLVASGTLGESGRLGDATLSLSADNAARLADWIPVSWRATPALWHGPAALDIEASGPPEALAVRLRLAMADARLEAQPTIDLGSGQWSGSVMLRHPGARRFLATLGLPERFGVAALPAWLGEGSLSLVAQIATAPGRLAANSFDLTAASLRATGRLAATTSGGEPKLTGRLSIETLPLPLPDIGSEVPLPLAPLRGWQADMRVEIGRLLADFQPVLRDAAANVTLANGVLRIDQFTGKFGGGTLAGGIALDSVASPPALAVQAQVKGAGIEGPLDEAPLDLLSGQVDGSIQAVASGYSPSAMLATLTGRATATVTDGVLAGFDLFRVKHAAMRAEPSEAGEAMASGTTGFDRLELTGRLAHGDLALDSGQLSAAAGNAAISGNLSLANQTMDLRVVVRPAVADPPEIGLRLAGPTSHASRNLELSSLARWLADHAQ